MIAIIVTIIIMNISVIPQGVSVIISAALIWISVLFTVLSGVDYLIKNWSLLKLK